MNRRWEDWVNVILGAWLCLSPWLWHYATLKTPTLNSVIPGAIIVVLAIWALLSLHVWEEFINLFLGLWLMFSPWLLSFSKQLFVTWNMAAVGLVVAILSAAASEKGPSEPPSVTTSE